MALPKPLVAPHIMKFFLFSLSSIELKIRNCNENSKLQDGFSVFTPLQQFQRYEVGVSIYVNLFLLRVTIYMLTQYFLYQMKQNGIFIVYK